MDDLNKADVLGFISAVEDGNKGTADMYNAVVKFDPLLSYFLLRYLREKHPVTDRSSGAGERLLDLVKTYPEIGRLASAPKNEPMIEWFDDSYSTRSYFSKPQEYVDLIVDKLEG
ncbi:MAG: hypothetical protein AB8G05_26540 [Oligoflexales bacterium]